MGHQCSPSEVKTLTTVLANMSYGTDQSVDDLRSIKVWLKEKRKGHLTSSPASGAGGATNPIRMKAFGEEVVLDLVEGEERLSKVLGSITVSKQDKASVNSEGLKRFQTLLKGKRADLILLESFAGSVPAWQVKLHDEPTWIPSTSSRGAKQVLDELLSGSSIVKFDLDRTTYSLQKFVKVLSAAVQVEKPVTLVISVEPDPKELQMLFPVLYLIDAVNDTIMGSQPLNAILLSKSLASGGFFRSVREIVDKVLVVDPRDYELPFKSAAIDLTRKTGECVHFVVTDTADIQSAISSIHRNIWGAGIRYNHMCRPLLFVHQSIHDKVCDGLAKSLKDKDLQFLDVDMASYQGSQDSDSTAAFGIVRNSGTAMDLVSMKTPGKANLCFAIPYRSIGELVSLSNGFGHTHKLNLYSTDVTSTSEIGAKLDTARLVINDSDSTEEDVGIIDFSYGIVLTNGTLPESKSEKRSISIEPNKVWPTLPGQEKAERLTNFLNLGDTLSDGITRLFISQLFSNPKASVLNSSKVNGILIELGADSEASLNLLKFAITAYIFRGGQIVVMVTGPKERWDAVSQSFIEQVKNSFPHGLVAIHHVSSVGNVAPVLEKCELAWFIHAGEDGSIPTAIPNTPWNKAVLISEGEKSAREFGNSLMKDARIMCNRYKMFT